MPLQPKLVRRAAPALVAAAAAALWAAVPSQAAFPGKNGRVAFASQTLDARGQLVRSSIETVNPDGSGRALLLTCRRRPRSCHDGSPAWSPHGALLAFAGLTRLGTVTADGSHVERLRRRTLDDGDPAWAPAGGQLAFTGQPRADAPVNVFVLGCSACGIREVTFRGATEPAWSTSDRIAFTRRGNIYTMGSTAKRAKRLTFKGGIQADWSPHASKLAFVRKGNVYIVRRDGSGLKRITGKGGREPVWSPNGKQLAFVRRGAIYVVGTDKKGLRRLAPPQAEVPSVAGEHVSLASPSWQPTR